MTSLALRNQRVAAKKPWAKEGTTGPCWSCGAPNSPRYGCESQRHAFYTCEEACGQKADADGWVDWDNCHECQAEDVDSRYAPDADMDDAGESGERSYSGWWTRMGRR